MEHRTVVLVGGPHHGKRVRVNEHQRDVSLPYVPNPHPVTQLGDTSDDEFKVAKYTARLWTHGPDKLRIFVFEETDDLKAIQIALYSIPDPDTDERLVQENQQLERMNRRLNQLRHDLNEERKGAK
jgi:hypothetical protein